MAFTDTDEQRAQRLQDIQTKLQGLRLKIEQCPEDKADLYVLLGKALKEGMLAGLSKHQLFPEVYPEEDL